MTQEDFEFLTILKDKWNATKRTGSRSIITAEDVVRANEIHINIFGSGIKPCSACFLDAVTSLIIQRDLYEESLPPVESVEPTTTQIDEEPISINKRRQKKS